MNRIKKALALVAAAGTLAVGGTVAGQVVTAEPAEAAYYTNCFASSQYYAPAGRVVLGTYCKRWPSNFYERQTMTPGEWVWIKAGNHG